MTLETARRTEAVWRIEAARIVAAAAHLVRDVGLAEDLAQEALIAALEHWPVQGIPNNPGAWLTTVAKNKALDYLRTSALQRRKREELGEDADARGDYVEEDILGDITDDIGDDLLRLIFVACHPILPRDAQTALTLKVVGGLSTAEIARAYLVSEATMAQRIGRAKKVLSEAAVPFEVPHHDDRAKRLTVVHEVVYLIFNEGYAASTGSHWTRPELCNEALRLSRMLSHIIPDDAETHGLQALLEIQASRLPARTDANGRPVLLMDQDRTRWDRLLIGRGLAALERAKVSSSTPGTYALQAAIAACHARATTPEATEWLAIVALYDDLAELVPSPIVELNRAVAISRAFGPAVALPLVQELSRDAAMQRYGLLHAVLGDLLARLGRPVEARQAFDHAAELATNSQDEALMRNRAAALSISTSSQT